MVYLCFRNFMLGETHSYPDNGQFKRPIFQKDAPCPARPGACSLQSRLLLLLPLRGRGRRVPWHLLRLNRLTITTLTITREYQLLWAALTIKCLKRADSNSGPIFRVVFLEEQEDPIHFNKIHVSMREGYLVGFFGWLLLEQINL